VWVLDTETKGTGAEMVPLEKVLAKPSSPRRARRARTPGRRPAPPPAPRGPRRFKVVDVMTRETIAADTGTRETVDVLRGIRSVVDVSVHVREGERWRPLTLTERKALWSLRGA